MKNLFAFLCFLLVPHMALAGGLSNVQVPVPPNLVDTSNANLAFGGTLSALTTGTQNICVGLSTCAGLTTAVNSVIINNGESMLASGNSNIIIGYLADVATAATTYGIAIGVNAIAGSYDTGVGLGALQHTSTDNNANAGFGYRALYNVTTGTNNVAMGELAATNIAGGSSFNTVLGSNAGNRNTTYSSNTVIGYSVGSTTLSGSNNILIGVSSAIDATTTTESNAIHIGGTGGDGWTVTGTGTQATQAQSHYGTNAFPNIATDATHTDSSVCQDTTTHIIYSGSGTLGICLGTSSQRYKRNVVPMKEGLAQIESLKPIRYYYKKGHGDDGAKQQFGFLAEDVESVIPDLVGLDKDGHPNSVDLLGMVPVLIHAMQQQQKEIDQLRGKQ